LASELAVGGDDLGGRVVPGELTRFGVALFAKSGGKRRMTQNRENLARKVLSVPEINLEHVMQHFSDAALFADDDRDIVGECVERRDAEGFGDAGHDVEGGFAESFFTFFFVEEAGEGDAVLDIEGFGEVFEGVEHFALAGDDEMDFRVDGEDFLGGLEEEVGAFLFGEAAEEEDLFFVRG